MIIFPAIDLRGGNAVRLEMGDYGKETVYSTAPEAQARAFLDAGATHLHVVDLDGARQGVSVNEACIATLAALPLFIEVGGGIRDAATVERYLSYGVDRVILGTAAVNDPPFLTAMLERYGDRVAVGVDAKDGLVAVEGWQTVTRIDGVAFCRRLREMGAAHVIYTDISRDGRMQGTNLSVYEILTRIEGLHVTASGGVSYLDEIAQLGAMGVYAAIVGKAVYEGKLDLKAALAAAKEQP